MNHVPDEVLGAVDEFGESLLLGNPESTATCRYRAVHTQSPPAIRDRGSFMTTIIDGIDERLEQWGIEPPAAYTYAATVDGTHHYEGTLQLP